MKYDIPFYPHSNSIQKNYPWLNYDKYCDYLIIGSGLTGCFIADSLSKKEENIVLISEKPVGLGESCKKSGAIFTNHIFTNFNKANKNLTNDNKVSLYNNLLTSLEYIENFCASTSVDCSFKRCDLLSFTNNISKKLALKESYLLQKSNDVDCSFLLGENQKGDFSFNFNSAIYSKNCSATLDPYMLCHALLKCATKRGVSVFDNTTAVEIEKDGDSYIVTTNYNRKIFANNIIFTSLENCKSITQKTVSYKDEYTLITSEIGDISGWKNQCIINSLDSPYFQIAKIKQNRIAICGLASKTLKLSSFNDFYNTNLNNLEEKLQYILKGLRNVKIDYAYKTKIVQTSDHLPLVGEIKEHPNCYCAFSSDDNCIAYSHIASKVLDYLIDKTDCSFTKAFDLYR